MRVRAHKRLRHLVRLKLVRLLVHLLNVSPSLYSPSFLFSFVKTLVLTMQIYIRIISKPKCPWANYRIHTRISSFRVCHTSTPIGQRAGQSSHCAHLPSTQPPTATFLDLQRQRPPDQPQSSAFPPTSRDEPLRQPAIRPIQPHWPHPFLWPVSIRYRSLLI